MAHSPDVWLRLAMLRGLVKYELTSTAEQEGGDTIEERSAALRGRGIDIEASELRLRSLQDDPRAVAATPETTGPQTLSPTLGARKKTIARSKDTARTPGEDGVGNVLQLPKRARDAASKNLGRPTKTTVPGSGASEHDQPPYRQMERAAASTKAAVRADKGNFVVLTTLWVDGALCHLLFNDDNGERFYLEGELTAGAKFAVLGGSRWPLKNVTSGANRYELVGMMLGHSDRIFGLHATRETTANTES